METNIKLASNLFKVLGNETRLTILYLLNERDLTVSELIHFLDLDQSLVSHQLKVLKDSDLVRATKVGKNVIYKISDNHVKTIYDQAIKHVSEGK